MRSEGAQQPEATTGPGLSVATTPARPASHPCRFCGGPVPQGRSDKEHCSDSHKFALWDRENPRLKKASTQQLELALKARDRGIERVRGRNHVFIQAMRKVAVLIAESRPDRTVTADDLREWLKDHPEVGEPTSYNAYGAIFSRNPDFEFHGYYTSRQKQGHGNLIRRWRLSMKKSFEDRSLYARKVCGNVPDEDGLIAHGKGCYTQSAEGGGQSFVEFDQVAPNDAGVSHDER